MCPFYKQEKALHHLDRKFYEWPAIKARVSQLFNIIIGLENNWKQVATASSSEQSSKPEAQIYWQRNHFQKRENRTKHHKIMLFWVFKEGTCKI